MSNPSYNDLSSSMNRTNHDGRLTDEPGPAGRSISMAVNGASLSRGLSRERDHRAQPKAGGDALSPGIEQHPGTAGSQGRRLPVSQQTSTNQMLPSKRSMLIKQSQQQLAYAPESSQNYASQRVGDQTMANSSNNHEDRQLPLLDKAATATGSLSVLNQGLLASASKQRTLHMKTNSLAKEPYGALKADLSMQEPEYNELQDRDLKFCAKSKSNISIQPQKQQVSSEQAATTVRQPDENNPNEMKLGSYGKSRVQMRSIKINSLHKRGSQSNHISNSNGNFDQIEVSPTNARQAGNTQATMAHESIDELNPVKPSSKHFSTNPAPQALVDGHRKMSLAAKAGQMQIFNNINNQQLNHGTAAAGAPEEQQRQLSGLPYQMNYNYTAKAKNPAQHHSSLPPQPQPAANQHQPVDHIPPMQSLQQTTLGSRQLDSYLGRRQIIQEQREKKQGLLKQLDLGRHNSQNMNPQSFPNTRNMQNATDGAGAVNGHQLVIHNQPNQYGNIGGNAVAQSSLRLGESMTAAENAPNKFYSMQIKQMPSEQGFQQGVSPSRFQRGAPLPHGGNGLGNPEIASARKKPDGRSYGGIEQGPVPSSAVNTGSVTGQSTRQGSSYIQSGFALNQGKYRASDVNLQTSNSPHFENSTTTNPPTHGVVSDMPGVSGISLSLAAPQGSHLAPSNGPDVAAHQYQLEKQQQIKDTTNRNKALQQMNHQVSSQQSDGYPYAAIKGPGPQGPEQMSQNNMNSRITRKLEGGRPHKVYDYMFIQMSNEQFKAEYAGRKIIIQTQDRDRDGEYNTQSPRKIGIQNYQNTLDSNKYGKKFTSPNKSPGKVSGFPGQSQGQSASQNLNGLVKIRAYDSQVTDELPLMQCNLLPTQLDHVKLLICEQDDKNYPKLTPDAQNRFEIEKQNQIKQYMEDIIQKLQQKDRKFKVTVKKKFVDDALYNSTSIRVASVYVIVVNREKTYDPLLNQKFFRARKRTSDNLQQPESSEEEEDQENAARKDSMRRSANPNLMTHGKKRSMYDSDTNGGLQVDQMNSTSASSNIPQFKKLMFDKNTDSDKAYRSTKGRQNSNGPSFKRAAKKEDETTMGYRYHSPVKEYPAKYGPTKIRIIQDVKAHDHHRKHPLNVFFNQYNEFMRLVFKNKNLTAQKFNANYAMGLAKALGLNLKKDAFSEQNLKAREHLSQMKEKLIFCFYRKIYEQNHKDNADAVAGAQAQQGSDTGSNKNDNELDDSVGSALSNNKDNSTTPKSKKGLTLKQEASSIEQPVNFSAMAQNSAVALPHPNVIYKYFIGKGNNSMMVRSLFKNRYWWVQNDKEEMEKCNFCWTQIKNNKLMEVLPCKFPNKKSGIKGNGVQKKQNTQLLATPQHKSNKKKKNTGQQNSEKQGPEKKGAPALGDAASSRFTEQKLYNKIEDNFHMNNKKALYLNMKNYYEALDQDVFANLPLTFHVKNGLDDPEFQRFEQYYAKCEEDVKNKKAMQRQKRKDERELREKAKDEDDTSPHTNSTKKTKEANDEPQYYQSLAAPKNIWIIKPGENTNRGQGIQVAKDFAEIKDIIIDSTQNRKRTCIVQKYIHNPLLIHRRKFDIRTFALMTSVNGTLKAYLYEEGYLRTSCREYSINNLNNKLVHLTNDAVQKRSEDYGKFEPGNKLSYNEFQAFLDKNYPDLNICFERDMVPQMNKMTTDVFRACHGKLDPKRRLNCMEVFGLDFMICDEFRPYLIVVNTNPCLELSSPLLARLIPTMLENSFKIGLDGVFFPPEHFSSKKAFIGDACPENRYTLCFDDSDPLDGPYLDKVFATKDNIIIEMDEDELSDEEVHDDEE